MTSDLFNGSVPEPTSLSTRTCRLPETQIPGVPTVYYVVGDVRAVLGALPAGWADLLFTSPPFSDVRDYLPVGHPLKHLEIGSEKNPGEFINTLLDVTELGGRALTKHGSLAVELGDTYSSQGGGGGDTSKGAARSTQMRWNGSAQKRMRLGKSDNDRPARKRKKGWPLPKSAALIPELYRLALAYGHNPRPTACGICHGDGNVTWRIWRSPCDACNGAGWWLRPTTQWIVRNTVTWCRPNPQPGDDGDKVRPATSDIVMACKSPSRWFDLDAVREPRRDGDPATTGGHPGGPPPLDWWSIPVASYPGAHYAVMNAQVAVSPVKMMCPKAVCRICGEPRRRITMSSAARLDETLDGSAETTEDSGSTAEHVTLGWTSCDCPDPLDGSSKWRRGMVLDPFGGSGTTGMVATGLGRDCVMIDFDERNAVLAEGRVGGFFFKKVTVAELIALLAPPDTVAENLQVREPVPESSVCSTAY